MRLTQEEQKKIIAAINSFVQERSAELRLYGSRADDQQKGGDIDLLLLLQDKNDASILLSEKHKILAAIKEKIGDQKIDLKITDRKATQQDSFLRLILPKSILLHVW